MQLSVQDLGSIVEPALLMHLPQCGHPGSKPLDDALHYAVFPGGKRLRPILSILGARVFGGDLCHALPAACAVEFVHTSSLIFDDLPCMDDAEIRRGNPALHRVYGEEIALLAGIALLNKSYAIFGRSPELVAEAAGCIGVDGMIGGQALDVLPQYEVEESPAERHKKLAERNRKTSAMMRLAFTAGALACGAAPAEVAPLGAAGQGLGEAYQICDDLLDVRRSSMHTGKTAGQDGRHRRLSYGVLDEQVCVEQVIHLIEEARQTLRAAYGSTRSAEVMTSVDRLFTSLIPEGRTIS